MLIYTKSGRIYPDDKEYDLLIRQDCLSDNENRLYMLADLDDTLENRTYLKLTDSSVTGFFSITDYWESLESELFKYGTQNEMHMFRTYFQIAVDYLKNQSTNSD